jgi:hypothetical protein
MKKAADDPQNKLRERDDRVTENSWWCEGVDGTQAAERASHATQGIRTGQICV